MIGKKISGILCLLFFIQVLYQDIMTANYETKDDSNFLTPNLLFLTFIVFCLFGILTNSYSLIYMKENFDLSKIIYKVLFWSCYLNIGGFIAVVAIIILFAQTMINWLSGITLWMSFQLIGFWHFEMFFQCKCLSLELILMCFFSVAKSAVYKGACFR